jgi:hypothetical protein
MADNVDMSLAVEMLMYSVTAKGRNGPFIQFDTMRKVRGTYTKSWDSSPAGVAEGSSFSNGTGKVRSTACPSQSQSLWMTNFLLGAQDRMGYNTKAQLGLQMRVITTMLSLVQEDVEELAGEGENGLVKFGALVAILTAGSLRGYEGFYLDLAATLKFLPHGRTGKMPKSFSRNT